MEAITYGAFPVNATRSGQKLAKIGQDKLTNLLNKYNGFLKELTEKPAVQAAEPVTPVAPTVNQPVQPMQPSVVQPLTASNSNTNTNNYKDVVDSFGMTVYANSFNEKTLAGARKIRVNPKVSKHTKGLGDEFGKTKLQDVTLVQNTNVIHEESPMLEEIATPTVEKVEESNVLNEIKTANVASVNTKENIPSVDDYLQKEVPKTDDNLITELSSDVIRLREEAKAKMELLQQLESQYNDLQNQKARQIKALEEERLSYTATLEGLTDKIKNLQSAIAKERQNLGDTVDEVSSFKR